MLLWNVIHYKNWGVYNMGISCSIILFCVACLRNNKYIISHQDSLLKYKQHNWKSRYFTRVYHFLDLIMMGYYFLDQEIRCWNGTLCLWNNVSVTKTGNGNIVKVNESFTHINPRQWSNTLEGSILGLAISI